MSCFSSFVVGLIALLAIGIFTADARAPKKLLSSTDARPGELKYQVALQRRGYITCGGALISESHVLTAAHCLVQDDAGPSYIEDLIIVTGTTNPESGDGEHHYPKFATIYPDYVKGNSKNRWRHDIAVITLDTPAVSNVNQAPISLASSDITTSVTAMISGWGQMARGWDGKYPDVLQKSPVTILIQDDCNARNRILETQICGFDGAGTGFCHGDSGSPLVYNNEVVGIVSFAVSCGLGYPDVYTRVWSYRDFIVDTMKRK